LRIALIGCDRLGQTTGACLAQLGHDLVCVDKDQEKINQLNAGNLRIYEPFLDEIIRRNRSEGRLQFTTNAGAAVQSCEAIFICVGVRATESGEADLSEIDSVMRVIATHTDSQKLVVIRSTVPVQTGHQLKRMLMAYSRNPRAEFLIAGNPQFQREGTAVEDFFHPSRILFGVEDGPTEMGLREVYKPLLEHRFDCPVHSKVSSADRQPELLVTSLTTAELIKHASNCFLAVKISYVNMVADLCEKVGADVKQVTRGMGLDKRIGIQLLRAGLGFGGFRLPQDLRTMISLGDRVGVNCSMMSAAERVNTRRIDLFIEKLQSAMWVVQRKIVGVLGLAYKPDTDDIGSSPALDLLRRLRAMGAVVRAFDPRANDNARRAFADAIYMNDPYEIVAGADALLITTEWDQFRQLDWKRIHDSLARPLLLDGRNFLVPEEMKALGFEYYSIGRPAAK
jgi:UDPglucose 6-dehydrogenase